MDTLWQDIRFTCRSIRKNPGVTAIAVFSLALGVGANTTIFTLMNAALLGPLPVARPSELVAVYTTDQSNIGGLGSLNATSYLNFKDLRERNTYLSGMAGYSFPQFVSVITDTAPQQGFVELVTGSYSSVLGVKAAHGRVFDEHEDTRPGDAAVAVVSYGFWQRRLGGDASAVDRVIRINGTAFTIVGIAPEGFKSVNSLISPDMWLPSMMYAQVLPAQTRDWINERRALLFFIAARLRPGATIQQAEANLKSIAGALERGSNVLGMVLRQGMTLVGIGLAIGIVGALGAARLVSRLLFGMSGVDPITFAGVCVVLVLVAMLASYIPAWRASRLDPLQALR